LSPTGLAGRSRGRPRPGRPSGPARMTAAPSSSRASWVTSWRCSGVAMITSGRPPSSVRRCSLVL